MKKRLIQLMTIIMGLCTLSLYHTEVQAKESYADYYVMQCNGYEVDIVNDAGYFDKQGCYAGFTEAVHAMNGLGDDAVVRHAESYSPSKIIAMNKGVAYSFPHRSNSVTLSIAGYGNSASTYIPGYRQMDYWNTLSYNGDGTGSVYITVTGFDGTVDLRNVDLIPQKFIRNYLPLYLGGNDITAERSAPFYIRPKRAYYTVRQNGNYRDLVFVAYSGYAVGGNTPRTVAEIAVGPAAAWMNVGDVYYSYDDIRYFSDPEYRSQVGVYYNYYQFLPLRSKSNIGADKYNGFLNSKGYATNSVLWNAGQYFVDAQNYYGVNAMMIFAQACLEAAYGTSNYAVHRYNLFGWNAVDSDPDRASYYSSVGQSVNEQMGIQLRNGYLNTRNHFSYYGSFFGNKGMGISVKYASTPYYGISIAAIAYSFDKYASGNNGTLTDYGSVKIGFINADNVNIRAVPENGNILYNSLYATGYQKFHFVAVLAEQNGWTKIQSTNHIVSGQSVDLAGNGSLMIYDWNESVGWINSQYINLIPLADIVHQLNAGEWLQDTVGKWYRHHDGTYTRANWEKIGDKWYFFDEHGYMLTGFHRLPNQQMYYFDETDGYMLTGFLKRDGNIYHFDSSGVMHIDWFLEHGEWYWANANGTLKTGWQEYCNRKYYLDETGLMRKGWVYTNDHYQYLDRYGIQQSGWIKLYDTYYYLGTDGNMRIGWVNYNNHYFYLDESGAMVKGWKFINGSWYYMNGNGEMQYDWQQINGQWYYLGASNDGSMKTGTQVIRGVHYSFNSSGVWIQ